jgi:predicted Rossmann fold nucleotide-binding protein DprA/Smf involved in DNA uptake
MEIIRLNPGDPPYPNALNKYLGAAAPSSLSTLGNLELLKQHKLALFCSATCPAAVTVQTHDLAYQLTHDRVVVISGFHSPVERECLAILLRGSQPIIVCPARSLKKMRIRREWKKPFDDGRLLFLSPFADHRHRGDTAMALYRNRCVAALANKIFVAYAAPSSKTEQFCREIRAWGTPLYTLESECNVNIIEMKAKALRPNQAIELTG